MKSVAALIPVFLDDRRGATMIEYSFIACLISITIIALTVAIGQQVRGFFEAIQTGFAG
jgi:Flp pilus assembly pilin Flp